MLSTSTTTRSLVTALASLLLALGAWTPCPASPIWSDEPSGVAFKSTAGEPHAWALGVGAEDEWICVDTVNDLAAKAPSELKLDRGALTCSTGDIPEPSTSMLFLAVAGVFLWRTRRAGR